MQHLEEVNGIEGILGREHQARLQTVLDQTSREVDEIRLLNTFEATMKLFRQEFLDLGLVSQATVSVTL